MLQLREEHQAISLQEDNFGDTIRDPWQRRLLRASSGAPFFFARSRRAGV